MTNTASYQKSSTNLNHGQVSISQQRISQVWICLLLFGCFLTPPAWGDGNVTFTISNRGDVTVTGDNFDNKIDIYLDFFFPEDVVIEGIDGTTITIIEPGFPPFTATEIYLDRNEIDLVRSLTLNLREGNNEAFISYLPPLIFGNFRIDMGRGQNRLFINLEEEVEVFRSINVRGSRSGDDSRLVFFGSLMNGDLFARQLSVDLGGNDSQLSIAGLQTSSNVSITTRGNNSRLLFGDAIVNGRTNLQNRGSFGGFMDVYFSDLIGRSSIQSRGNDGEILLEVCRFFADVNLRMGNEGNQASLIFNDFLSNRRSRFQAGRGENILLDDGNFFQTEPDIRNFEVIDGGGVPF